MFNRILAVASLAVFVGASAAVLPALADSPAASKRFITMMAVEPKGSTTVDKEPFPTASLPQGGGYKIKQPDATGRWEVSTYRWDPSQIIVHEGDDVTLEIVGINGAEHPSVIEGYGIAFNVKRGQVTHVNFKADRAGVFRIDCDAHRPSMVGELIVLPRL